MFRALMILAVAAALLVAAPGCDDDPASSKQEPRWSITIGGAGEDIPRDVARVGSQFVVVGSSDASDSGFRNTFIAVVDGDGAVLVDTVLSTDSRSSGNCVLPLGADRFVVGGYVGSEAFVMELDKSLTVHKSFTIPQPDEHSSLAINAMAYRIDGGYVLGGSHVRSQRPIPPVHHSWLAVVDEGDTLISSHLLPGNSIHNLEPALGPPYGFTWDNHAQTWSCDPGQPCDVSDICFGMCSVDGDTLWMKTIPGPSSEFARGLYANPAVVMVAGSDGADIWLGSYDHDGNEYETLTLVDTTGITWANDIDLGPASTYILCGALREHDWSDADALLIKLDHHAEVIWQKRLGGNQHDEALKVLPLAFGYLMLGRTESLGAGGSDIWLVRTDLDGRTE